MTMIMTVISILSPLAVASPDPPPPHIVMVLADDLGWNDLEFQGAGNRMQSPRLRSLVEENGIILDR
jgi:arylsulfatase A-like enzyme